LDGTKSEIIYEIVNLGELFMEAADGTWWESAVIMKAPLAMRKPQNEGGLPNEFEGADRDWVPIRDPDNWLWYYAPKLKSIGNVFIPPSTAQGSIVDMHVSRLLEKLNGERELAVLLRDSLGGKPARVIATLISKEAFGCKIDFAEFVGGSDQTLRFFRPCRDRRWNVCKIPALNPDMKVVDIVPLDNSGSHGLAVTNKEGLYLTMDGGKTWRNFNHRQERLLQAKNLKVVCGGSMQGVYALSESYSEDNPRGENLLFHYQERGWLERLRVALIDLLGGLPE
jgi:hypothetical protein